MANWDWETWWPQAQVQPWGQQWDQQPWQTGGWPMGNEESMVGQNWMSTILPWLQAQLQGNQWQETFDWTKQSDQWTQDYQQQQLDWQKEVDLWTKGLQEQQFVENEKQANIAAFGRKWSPNTRWA